jgi:hypothetical protein
MAISLFTTALARTSKVVFDSSVISRLIALENKIYALAKRRPQDVVDKLPKYSGRPALEERRQIKYFTFSGKKGTELNNLITSYSAKISEIKNFEQGKIALTQGGGKKTKSKLIHLKGIGNVYKDQKIKDAWQSDMDKLAGTALKSEPKNLSRPFLEKKYGLKGGAYERPKNFTVDNYVANLDKNKGKTLNFGRRFEESPGLSLLGFKASEGARKAGNFKDDVWANIIRDSQQINPDIKKLYTLDLKKSGLKEIPNYVSRGQARKLVFRGPDNKKITYDNFEKIIYPTPYLRNKIYDSHRVKQFYRELRTKDGQTLNMAIQKRMIDRFEVLRVNNPQEYKVLNKKLSYNDLFDLGFIRKKDFDNNFSLIQLDHTGKVGDLLTVLSTKASNNRAGSDAVLKAAANALANAKGKGEFKAAAKHYDELLKDLNIKRSVGGRKYGNQDTLIGILERTGKQIDMMDDIGPLVENMKVLKNSGVNLYDVNIMSAKNVFGRPMGDAQFQRTAGILDNFKEGGSVEDLSEPATDLQSGFLNSADIEAEIEMARVLDNKILTAPEAQERIIERFNNNFRDGGLAREDFQVGGSVGGGIGGGVAGGIGGAVGQNNRIGNIQSVLAGIAAGVIDIPKGVFSLGASLMDLGLGTSTAAKVENFFDNLTTFDETAEARTAGQIARIITNLGIPGSQAWKVGTGLARKAMFARDKGKYFTASDPKLPPKIDDALNAKGRLYATLGGAAGIGVADAIFVGDPERVGTLGDAFEFGPTQLRPNNENDAAREIMNRLKFGLDSSLLLGLVGGSGSAVKSMIKRRNELESNNDFIDKILSKIRPRGEKPMEFFRLERESIGIRAGDVNRAQEISRGVDRHIDGMFPFLKPIYEKATIKSRADLMKSLNDALLSGKTDFGIGGKINFGPMDEALVKVANEKMKALGAKPEAMKGVLNLFDEIRTEWGDMFTALGSRMDEKSYGKFSAAFSKKMTDYLGSTYDVFRNKSLIPMLNFKAGEEAVTKLVNIFKKTAKDKGEELTTEQARHYVDQIVESATPGGRGLPIREDATAGVYFKGNKLFEDLVDKSILGDVEFNPKVIQLNTLKPEAKAAIDEVLGKIQDPIQTILQGTQKLSLITRRNQFFDELLESSNKAKADGKKGFFYEDEADAFAAFGKNIKRIDFDPSKTLEAGVTNPLNGLYAPTGVANALEETSKSILDRLGTGSFATMYQNFILYPKATSQLAKTVLSPITHMRNLFSASAFAAANGLLPGFIGPDEIIKNMKSAYGKLQFGRADDPVANAEYRKLLRLGVVNSNVSLGDLSRLLEDVKFGENITATSGAKGLMRQFSKLKRAATDLYTAEDDLWKIYTFATERGRFEKAYKRAGIAKSADELDEIAADIVRNNVPNYDYVSDFIKGLRQFPIGNFVSFPAEIMRTSVNIMTRGLKEYNEEAIVNGVKVYPLRNIGLQRLFGFAATTTVIPYGLVEGAKAVYNVSGVEMDALRRFVPEWSKNSTIIPVRSDDGELKYVDFSHANAYDTMIRPITTLINNIRDGQIEEEAISKSILQGVFEATKELGQPFISEAIWTEAATDIIVRGGRTKDGRRLYTEQTPNGEKAMAIVGHLVDSQLPGSIEQFKRFDLAIEPIDIIQKGKFDKYGRDYKLSDELFGIIGMRAVEVDPVNSMKFKIADFTRGISNSRREFTSPLLRGGVVTPEQIVDRYQIANNQLYKVQREMFRDYYAARTLGANASALDREFKDRVSRVSLAAIKSGRFKPFVPSENIIKSFGENARKLGQRNPYLAAKPVIDRITRQFNNLPLILEDFPIIPNPFSITQPTLPTSGISTGLPNLNLGLSMPTGTGTTGNTVQKGQTVFGPLDPVFGGS